MQNHLAINDPLAQAHHQALLQCIKEKITANGAMRFIDYMQLALYAPGLGYYSAGKNKFGREGDFVTAPEISPLFAQCLANQIEQALSVISSGDILEFGAGSGILAADLLLSLSHKNSLPRHYYIIEVSADLKDRQQQLLKQRVPQLFHKIIWLDQLPSLFNGVILANEVLDAMPVHKFKIDNGIQEYYVDWQNEKLSWALLPGSDSCRNAVQKLNIEFEEGYESEINVVLPAWINSLNAILNCGLILLIDYGFPSHEYYHPDRSSGTLMCHYHHHAHMEPLILTGLQDITAHVDFTAIARAAVDAGLEVSGYTTQANFLLGCRLDKIISLHHESSLQWQQSMQIKQLILPGEMGELFKVIALTKALALPSPLIGFQPYDMRMKL